MADEYDIYGQRIERYEGPTNYVRITDEFGNEQIVDINALSGMSEINRNLVIEGYKAQGLDVSELDVSFSGTSEAQQLLIGAAQQSQVNIYDILSKPLEFVTGIKRETITIEEPTSVSEPEFNHADPYGDTETEAPITPTTFDPVDPYGDTKVENTKSEKKKFDPNDPYGDTL